MRYAKPEITHLNPAPLSDYDYLHLLALRADDERVTYRDVACKWYDCCLHLYYSRYPAAPGWTCIDCAECREPAIIRPPAPPLALDMSILYRRGDPCLP